MGKIKLYKEYLLEHLEGLLEHCKDNKPNKVNIIEDIITELNSTVDENKLQNIAERLDYLINISDYSIFKKKSSE